MKILLHIAQSKTGTSSIQAFLAINRKKLLEAGVLYPMPRRLGMEIFAPSHNALADSLLGVSRYPHFTAEQYFQQYFLQCKRKGIDQLILSGEHFWGGEPRLWNTNSEEAFQELYKKKIENLASYLKGHEVSIIVYLRPQVDWLASAIAHEIGFLQSAAMTVGEKNWIAANFYESDWQYFNKSKGIFRYCERLDLWNEILKPHSITAVPYIRNALHKQNSVTDFLYRTRLDQIDLPLASERIEANTSISREYVEVKKILNRTPKSFGRERSVIECLRKLSKNSKLQTGYKLQKGLSEHVEDYVALDNLRLSKNYIDNGHHFPARSSYSDDTLPDITDDEIEKAMTRFQEEYSNYKYRIRQARHTIVQFVRENAKPLHTFLHHVKGLI